jgi:hypothetical protein
MPKREAASELLSFLEQHEARLLTWGFYDIGFLPEEIEELLKASGSSELNRALIDLEQSGTPLSRLLGDMELAGLLYRPRDNQSVVRSRFAESMRLLARLRQIFRAQDWATGSRLVRDLKIHLTSRRYPKRDVDQRDAWSAISATTPAVQSLRPVFEALSGGSGETTMPYAGFQVRAFDRILKHYFNRRGLSATVVSAGTGSGKTKAFYVPAFLGISADLLRTAVPFTKVVAVYPRNVLLSDQLREALSEAQRLTAWLKGAGSRAITVGAFLGDTPPEAAFDAGERHGLRKYLSNWRRTSEGWVVPFLKSPRDGKSPVVWRDADRKAGRTRLFEQGALGGNVVVDDGVITLTREGLQRQPPDVLFLSLEMLNREIGNPSWAKTFGLDLRADAPRLLLLDEVHTYEGLSGAQVPWIIQRWLAASNIQNLHIVGLSATLRDPAQHMAAITGIRHSRIQEVAPVDHPDRALSEFMTEGMEYNVAVRGNVGSGPSLLATSIQTAMLLCRTLSTDRQAPPRDADTIEGPAFFGRKLFGFTDNLDTLNRWLADLVDADNRRNLAWLRTSDPTSAPDRDAAFKDGQVWELAEVLGHDLRQSLTIDRCSSQEPGLNPRASAVLATSSLEVGYDDPEVGVVLQHKAPSSMSSFIQRKGRAGRRRGTRPLTVAVLSDFGRDRWAYRDSHRLFGNTIESVRLPALNPYVLKIQSALFLIDWIGRAIGKPDPFRYLAQESDQAARASTRALLIGMLEGKEPWARFCSDLKSWVERYLVARSEASRVDQYLDRILWESPRPLIRHVVPTLLRQLDSPIQAATRRRRPIPEYIPQATFSELDSRELTVKFRDDPDREGLLESRRFFFEFCPGRVSKRFSVDPRARGYWLSASGLMNGSKDLPLSIGQVCTDFIFARNVGDIRIFEPCGVEVEQRPLNVKDSSQGSWNLEFFAEQIGEGLELPEVLTGSCRTAFARVSFHLHRDQDGVEIVRYARGGRYDLLFDRDQVVRGTFRLTSRADENGAQVPEAIGYVKRCDAIILEVKHSHLQQRPHLSGDLLARLRPDAFLWALHCSDILREKANAFAIGYLWQTSLAMLTATALSNRCSLREAQRLLSGKRVEAATAAITRLLHSVADDDSHSGAISRRQAQIVDLWRDASVLAVVEKAEECLWATADALSDSWLSHRYAHTLAQAAYVAATSILDDVPEGDLDIDVFEKSGDIQLVLSETTGGGLGHIETLHARLSEDPLRLDNAIGAALVHCERADADENLLDVVSFVRRGDEAAALRRAFQQCRHSSSFTGLQAARQDLRCALMDGGLSSDRASVTALMGTVLRPGSSSETDRWMSGLNDLWAKKNARVGVAIPPSVFSYWVARTRTYKRRLAATIGNIGMRDASDQQVFLSADGMLREGCADSCTECLGTGSFEAPDTKPSRSLAMQWLGLKSATNDVLFGEASWLDRFNEELRRHAKVTLRVPASQIQMAMRELHALAARQLDLEYLLVTPVLSQVRRRRSHFFLTWQIRGIPSAV